VHEDYVSSYDLGRFPESARFVRHYPGQSPILRDLLPSIQAPTQIVAGDHDPFVPWSNAEYLHQLLPHSEIHPSTPATTPGRKRPRNTAAASSTGSAAGTSASRASQPKRTPA
jgi:hypothetical protein